MSSSKQAAQELGEMLSKFCTTGIYGRFFSGKSNVDLTAQLVVIETINLIDEPDLMAVLVQMMILNINQNMAKSDRFFDQCGPASAAPHESESDIGVFRKTNHSAPIGNERLHRELFTETRKIPPEYYGSIA